MRLSVVSCQLSVVLRFRWFGGYWADGLQVAVELGTEFIQQGLEFGDGLFCKQLATVSAAQPMLRFIERTSGVSDKTSVVSVSTATNSLRDISANAIGGSNNLRTDRISRELFPTTRCIPDRVRYLLGQLVNTQVFKVRSHVTKPKNCHAALVSPSVNN
jgi:hypothetical protein